MNNGRGRRSYRNFVLNGADGIIFLESLKDTCESCRAVSCALCPLYHLNMRVKLRTAKGLSREEVNNRIEYMERGHIAAMNKKYDMENRYENDEWICSGDGYANMGRWTANDNELDREMEMTG